MMANIRAVVLVMDIVENANILTLLLKNNTLPRGLDNCLLL